MGLSGLILKKQEDNDIHKLMADVRVAAERAGLEPRSDSKVYSCIDGGVYATVNIADTYEDIPEAQQWVMDLYSEDDCCDRFDWILKNGNLIRVIVIDDFSGCEKILLDFLYEYFKLNPKDYFWDELHWYYTYEDILEMRQSEFDPNWCYKDPHLKNEIVK